MISSVCCSGRFFKLDYIFENLRKYHMRVKAIVAINKKLEK